MRDFMNRVKDTKYPVKVKFVISLKRLIFWQRFLRIMILIF